MTWSNINVSEEECEASPKHLNAFEILSVGVV
jgi:hypothetical protein